MNLLTIQQVCEKTSLSRSIIVKMCYENKFPQPIKIGIRRKAWLEESIDRWITDKLEAKND